MAKTVVVTGSSRGIGYGLADAFLARECNVVVNGRSTASVAKAIQLLSKKHNADKITGAAGDVSQLADHQKIWDTAVQKFGKVDIWINNAGMAHGSHMVWEIPEELISNIVDVNMKGVIYGSKVAMQNMLKQGSGHLYNMEGFGSNGRTRIGLSVYGATKSGVRFISRSLTKEAANTPIKVSTLSPGMVITDLLLDPYEGDPEGLERVKRIFNILADKVETVTPWLADRVLSNNKSGSHIDWLPFTKILGRFLTAPFNKRDLFT